MRSALSSLILILSVSLVAVPAAAQDTTVTAIAQERGCPGDKTFCWDVEIDGALTPGAEVRVDVVNPGDNTQRHNLYLMFGVPEETGENTEAGRADVNTSDLEPGEEESVTFTVPQGADELYYWCEVPGHESIGMWGLFQVQAEGGADGGTGSDGADGEETQSPGPGLIAGLAAVALAAFAMARRR